MADIRNERTREAIKDALLNMMLARSLDSISVSSLAKEAGVSRSTYYAHFSNTYEVYRLLVIDFLSSVSVMEDQIKCAACAAKAPERLPYCVAVRSAGKYRGVVNDKRYISTMLDVYRNSSLQQNALLPYLKLGLDEASAKDLVSFQMTGCHVVASSTCADSQWDRKKQLLDTFIAGGMNAVKGLAASAPAGRANAGRGNESRRAR